VGDAYGVQRSLGRVQAAVAVMTTAD
jgi:hypothetical protein